MAQAKHGAVVLFSGGQDSTTCLYWALREFSKVQAVSVLYGQRHAAEVGAAWEISALAGVPHTILSCDALGQLGDSALVSREALTASGGREDIECPGGLPSSFVPGRNLVLLTLAAAVAVKHGYRDVVSGVCQTDYSGYPDCRRPFVDSLESTLGMALPSSCGTIRIHTPLMTRTKAETVALAKELPGCWRALSLSVTCYEGKRPGCGVCPACLLRRKGFDDAGESDPAEEQRP